MPRRGSQIWGTKIVVKELQRRMGRIAGQLTQQATIEATNLVKRESVLTTPWKTGNLAGSTRTEFPARWIGEVHVGGIMGKFTVDGQPKFVDYAVKIHELTGSVNWSKEGTGPKFLENALKNNANKILGIYQARLRRGTM